MTARIIMKKPKILRLLTAASAKDIAGCYPGVIPNKTNKKTEGNKSASQQLLFSLKNYILCHRYLLTLTRSELHLNTLLRRNDGLQEAV